VKASMPIRVRLVLGSVLWTVGLIVVTNVAILGMIVHRYPGWSIHFGAMGTFATGLLVAGLIQLRSILGPFSQLRSRLQAVRDGREQRLSGGYPGEVQPLVDDLNALLDHRALLVKRAISKAGDLAHGLKTPLAVLGQEAEKLTKAGHYEEAAIIGQQVERMRRQIEYHLAHARSAASGATPGASSSVLASAEGLARTLGRLYVDKGVSFRVDASSQHYVRVERENLDEMLGNLLDNACKWADRKIAQRSTDLNDAIVIEVEDDGPGIPTESRERALQRGVRVDEAAPGSGLGLAIVADLVELHSGSIALESSPLGGLRVRLVLPKSSGPAEAQA